MRMELLILLSLLAFFAFPLKVIAQDTQYQPDVNNQQDNPGSTTQNGDNNNRFDWWWLIPLALLPLIPLLFRRDERRRGGDGRSSRRGEYERAAYQDLGRNRNRGKRDDDR